MPLAGLINNPIYALLTILLTSDVIAIFLASQSVPYHRLGRSVQSETQAVRTKPIVPTLKVSNDGFLIDRFSPNLVDIKN